MTDLERASGDPRSTRAWALVRVALGTAQVFGAVFAATLLVQTGVTQVALGLQIILHNLSLVGVFAERTP